MMPFYYAPSLLGFRGTPFTAQRHHAAVENTEIIILLTASYTTLSHPGKNNTKRHFLRFRKGPDDIILCVISPAGRGHAMR